MQRVIVVALMIIKATSSFNNHGGNYQTSCQPKGNNGFGNGHQSAPGNSEDHNQAENAFDSNIKNQVNNSGVNTHGGSEKDLKGNNGWGNGDQNAPGNSLMNNNAENNHAGLSNPSNGKNSNS
jgi:hypothetical protein